MKNVSESLAGRADIVELETLSLAEIRSALPQTGIGWVGFFGVCVCSTASILALFASTVRIGAFRTALIMNLEPVVSTVLSIVVLGEVLTPVQFVGGAIMVTALCAFQVRRG